MIRKYCCIIFLILIGCNNYHKETESKVNNVQAIICKNGNNPDNIFSLDEKNSRVLLILDPTYEVNKNDFVWDAKFTNEQITWIAKYKYGEMSYELNRMTGKLTMISKFASKKLDSSTEFYCEKIQQKF